MSTANPEEIFWGAQNLWLNAMRQYYLIYVVRKLRKKYSSVYPVERIADNLDTLSHAIVTHNRQELINGLEIFYETLNSASKLLTGYSRKRFDISYPKRHQKHLSVDTAFSTTTMIDIYNDVLHVSHYSFYDYPLFPRETWRTVDGHKYWNFEHTFMTALALVYSLLVFKDFGSMSIFMSVFVLLIGGVVGGGIAFLSTYFFQNKNIFVGVLFVILFLFLGVGLGFDMSSPLGQAFGFSSLVCVILIGNSVAPSFMLRKVDAYGPFSALWCRRIDKQYVEFIVTDSESNIVKASRTKHPRLFFVNFYDESLIAGLMKTMKYSENQWFVGYPSIMKPRGAVRWSYSKGLRPRNPAKVSSFNRAFNFASGLSYIPGFFNDAVEFGVPGLTIEALTDYLASIPSCCEPPGYEEFVALHGVEER